MKKLLLILLCFPLITFAQQTYVPDYNFENYLENNGMGNGIPNDHYVTTANINTVDTLNVYYMSIWDLTGIEDFSSLTTLNCYGNYLTSLDLSNNTALTSLQVQNNNQLSSLNVSNNTALTILNCWVNQLTNLDVSQNTSLTYLQCGSNQLTSLDLSQNTSLTHLHCRDNQLTSLDLSNNTALTSLYCYNNQLTSLDLSNNTVLGGVSCYNNQLTSLDLRNGNNLNSSINVSLNPNLYCINVDDSTWTTNNWTVSGGNIDSHHFFANNCTIYGCTDPLALNYDSIANINDGSCIYPIYGCTDVTACNYDSTANVDDSSCVYVYPSTLTVTACDTFYWPIFFGNPYSSSGIYTHTYQNVFGCLWTDTLILTINNSNTGSSLVTACDSYNWNGQIYTTSGTYSWTGTTVNGCDSTATLNLTINSIYAITNTVSICYGDSVVVGTNTYNLTGAYTDLLTSVSGCDSTITTNLTVSTEITAFIAQVASDITVNVLGGNTPYSYQWNTTETTQQITPTANGPYWVIVEDVNQCISDTVYFNVTWISTDISELLIVDLSIYPNPSEDIFNITFSSKEKQNLQLRVLNMLGEEVYTENLESFVGNYSKQIMLGKYPDAIYLLEIKTSEGIVNRKLMLQ